MRQTLLFLHLVGLILGAGPGVASAIAMRLAAGAQPAEAALVRRLPPILARVSALGLAILWITGLLIIWLVYGGVAGLPASFWIKMVFVVALTAANGFMHVRMAEVRRGNVAAAAQLPILGASNGVLALLAVLFAVIAFD